MSSTLEHLAKMEKWKRESNGCVGREDEVQERGVEMGKGALCDAAEEVQRVSGGSRVICLIVLVMCWECGLR